MLVEHEGMTFIKGGVRRVLVGKEVGVILGILLAGSLLIQGGFLPAYIAVLFASGIRNVYVAWLGNGVLFWAVAFLGLYTQAILVTTSYLAVRTIGERLRKTPPGKSSA